ncbi:hypothetical protein GCM10009560_47340 [Nonomuraea longicatena]|uniref:Transposase n=1 Tax=Nonomuraea longicatena TaxID=83682 RepID=A0ABN1Q643_9ACTN
MPVGRGWPLNAWLSDKRLKTQQDAPDGRALEKSVRVTATPRREAPPERRYATPDADGHNSKPNPLEARTPAELVEAMRRYRVWAANRACERWPLRCNQAASQLVI